MKLVLEKTPLEMRVVQLTLSAILLFVSICVGFFTEVYSFYTYIAEAVALAALLGACGDISKYVIGGGSSRRVSD